MLEKIKKLLDSGCYVEVNYEWKTPLVGMKNNNFKLIAYGVSSKNNIIFEIDGGTIITDDELFLKEIEVLSIKPIARPLYQYKEGDKVVVLDNDRDKEIHGMMGSVNAISNGNILVNLDIGHPEVGQTIWFDIRCIAPVLD